jgi:hypothetical protein
MTRKHGPNSESTLAPSLTLQTLMAAESQQRSSHVKYATPSHTLEAYAPSPSSQTGTVRRWGIGTAQMDCANQVELEVVDRVEAPNLKYPNTQVYSLINPLHTQLRTITFINTYTLPPQFLL